MAVDFKKIADYLSKHKKVLIIGVIALAIIYGLFLSPKKPLQEDHAKWKGNITTEERYKAEVEGLKKTIEELKKQIDTSKKEKDKEEPTNVQVERQEKPESLKELEKAIAPKKKLPLPSEDTTLSSDVQQIQVQQQSPPPRLIKIDVPVVVKEETKAEPQWDIYLPASSFASFTLTSGAYAPESGEQMPVSGVIDKAFIGPNKSAIPLKGCLFLGKARGNIGYKIADIKVVKIACVWPNGGSFEADISGYVTDTDGNFGLRGKVIRHTGAFFSTTGITSFIEGFAAGLARAQEKQEAVSSQFDTEVTTNIIGSSAQYGLFKGVQEFASAAKQFFSAQLQGLIPAVEVPAGARGYMFITSGVKISGGKNALYTVKNNYYDSYNLSSTK